VLAGEPRPVTPAFPVPAVEVAMSTDDGIEDGSALDLLPERYRSLFWSTFSTLGAGGLLILDLLAEGRPLGGVELAMVGIGVATNIAVWWPKSHVAKFVAAVAGAMAMATESALTDGRVTSAEGVVLLISFGSAFGLSLQPNARVIRGEVVESPVATRVEVADAPVAPRGSTYMPPSQRISGEDD
jgi:hypothetical protein